MRRIVVTGGAGYIGSVLCDHLINQGDHVTCIDRCFFGLDSISRLTSSPHFRLIRNDVRFATPEMFKGADVVMDLSGISNDPACDLDPKLTEEINFHGAVHVASQAKQAGVKRHLFSSSCSIYGKSDGQILTEDSPINPVSAYAASKIRAENQIKELASDKFCVTFLRNATVYGVSPKMRFDLVINIMTMYAVLEGKISVLGGGRQWRPIIHLKDVARAFCLVMDAPAATVNGQAFNVGSTEQNYQVIQIARMVQSVLPSAGIHVVPDDDDKRNYHVSFKKIESLLGFAPTTTAIDGIKEVAEAIRTGGVDPSDLRTSTLKYYRYLIDADKRLQDVKLDGRLF